MNTKPALLVRSLVFDITFAIWTALVGLYWTFPILITKSTRVASKLGYSWAIGSLFLLEKICNIKVNVVGIEHIQKKPCIIASKHESVWETIFFFKLLINPSFLLKKELTKIPIYGWHLKAMGMICIDRSDGIKSIKQATQGAKEVFDDNRCLVIFPEGTRTPHGIAGEVKPGVAAIHNKFPSMPIVPASLDSGLYWNNRSWIKNPGTINLEFKPPIEIHMKKNELLDRLSKDINSNT